MPTKRSKEIGGWGERQPVSLETSDASTWTGRRYREPCSGMATEPSYGCLDSNEPSPCSRISDMNFHEKALFVKPTWWL